MTHAFPPRLRPQTIRLIRMMLVVALLLIAWGSVVHAQSTPIVTVAGSSNTFSWSYWVNLAVQLVAFVLIPGGGLAYGLKWAVTKHLVQQRWVPGIEAAAQAGATAGLASGAGPSSPAFWTAAGKAVLAYSKAQMPDVIDSKGMPDLQVVQAGLARVMKFVPGDVSGAPDQAAARGDAAAQAMTTAGAANIVAATKLA